MQFKTIFGYCLVFIFAFNACQSEWKEPVPDVSSIEVPLEIRRFEKDLFALDTNNWNEQLANLEAQYPEFGSLFFERILQSKQLEEDHAAYVKGFVQHPSVQHLYDTCMTVFGDIKPIESEFRQAFQFYKYYFPRDTLGGTVTTFISEYTNGVLLYGNNNIGVGLDFFLGAEYPYQKYNPQNPNFSGYLSRTFSKEHLVPKAMRLLLEDRLGHPEGLRLLDMMVQNGKKLYLLDKVLPYAADSVKMEVTTKQMDWLNNNEREIWAYFLTENLLYSTDFQEIRKYVEYSPHSPGMPPDAPGRTGNWLGWQIIKAYMRRHPDTTMDQLIDLKDAQVLLDESRYKPER